MSVLEGGDFRPATTKEGLVTALLFIVVPIILARIGLDGAAIALMGGVLGYIIGRSNSKI